MGTRKAALSGPLADIDIRLLKVFITVVESGGFSAAEIQLNLANSTISNYMADLEKRLQMTLCRRGRAGFSLTDQGELVYLAARQLLQAMEGFRNTINEAHNQLIGELRLGLAEHMLSVHNTSVVDTLAAFTNKAPEVKVHISTLASDEVTTATIEGKVDIGITVLPQAYPELQCQDLFDESMTLYCGKGHPLFERHTDKIDPQELQQYRFVESPRLMQGREAFPEVRSWQVHAKAHHQEARAALILSGNYLGFLPQHLVENWGLSDRLRAIATDAFSYSNTFTAIWRPARAQERLIRAFRDCL